MKKLFNWSSRNEQDENLAGNWLYFAGTPGGPDGPSAPIPEEEKNIEQQINSAMKSPLGFGMKELRFLEEHQKDMNPLQERRFRNIAGYQLSLTRGKDMAELPPRMLSHLADSPLIKLLPTRMRKQILAEVDEQMRSLDKILNKNADSWTTFELSKVCVLYRRLRKNSVMKSGTRDGVFEKARKKIVEKAFQLMTKPITASEKVDNTISKEDRGKAMTLEEKVLVLEIRRMFPQEKSWAEKSRLYDWDRMAVETISSMFKDEKTRNSLLVNPNMSFTWELLRDFLGDNPGTSSVGALQKQIIDKIKLKNLKKAFKTTEAIKLLQFARNSRIFLPTHLQALQEILKKKEDGGIDIYKIENEEDWREFGGEKSEEIRKLDKKLIALQKKKNEYVGKGLEDYLKLTKIEQAAQEAEWERAGTVKMSELPVIKDKHKELKNKEKDLVKKAWDEKVADWITKSQEYWETKKEDKKKKLNLEKIKEEVKLEKIDDGPNKTALKEALEKDFAEREKEIETGVPNKFKEFKDKKDEGITSTEEQDKFIKEFRDFLFKHFEDDQKSENFKKFDEEYRDYTEKKNKITKSIADISSSIPPSDSTKKDIDEVTKKVNKLKEEVATKAKDSDSYKTWSELLKAPEKVAKNAKKTFFNNLEDRINNRTLYAADFDILWGDRELHDPQNPFYEELTDFHENLKNLPQKEKLEEFRGKFENILSGIFDEVELTKLSDKEDKFTPWYRELDNALSYDNILARLKEEGFDLQQEFASPQQISQLIDGAIRNYREEIFESIKPNLDDLTTEEQQEFYTGWDRLHGGLDGVTDPTELSRRHLGYEQEKSNTKANVKKAHEGTMAHVEYLKRLAEEATDPAKEYHYLEEARKLEESFEYRKHAYEKGGNFWDKDENGKSKQYWAPGKELLNELDLQTQGVAKEISQITGDLRKNIEEIADSFRGISSMHDPLEKKLKQSEAKNNLEELFGKWAGTRENLRGKFADMGTIITEIIPGGVAPDEFVDEILKVPNKMLDSFEGTMSELKKYARKVDFKFTGKESFWKVFADNFLKLETALNFQSGSLAQEGNRLDKYLEESNKTLEFLTKIEFFDDDTAEREKFTENYEEISKGFKDDFKIYTDTVREMSSRLRKDFHKLSDEKFFEKYGLDKEYMEDLLSKHENTVHQFKNMSDKFFSPRFLKDWIHRYEISPQDRAEAIAEMGDFNALSEHAKNAREYAEKMQRWVTEYDDNADNSGKVRNYQRFSLYDLYAIVKQAIEVHERRWKRDSDKAVAEIGMNFFGEKSAWGKEFKQKAEESEENRVKEFETQYGEYPGWDLQDALYRTNDADEAKALIRLLLTKGFMQWDDPKFWMTLERLSKGAVKFRNPEDLSLSRLEILNKVRNSCEFIWSVETFRQWENEFESKLKSAVDGHNADFDRYEDDPGGRTRIMSTMLKRWSKGDSTNVDPARFECFISQSFEKGKMNGQPDQRWYFLVMGVATINPNTGRSLISRDALMRMNAKHMPKFPHLDFLVDKESYKKDGRIVPKDTPGARGPNAGWEFEDYLAWGKFMTDGNGSFDPTVDGSKIKEQTNKFFYHIVNISPAAQSRLSRMDRNAGKEADHDDAESFFAGWSKTHVVDTLSKASGGEKKATIDLWRGYLAGFSKYMKYMKEYIEEGDAKYGESAEWRNKDRKEQLMKVGDRFKTCLTVLQTLQGNGNLGENRGSLVLDAEEWRRDTAMSANADESRKIINDFTQEIFKQTDGGEEFQKLLEFKAGVEYGITWKDREAKLKESGIQAKYKKLLDTPESSARYFENTTAIENVLMNWTPPT